MNDLKELKLEGRIEATFVIDTDQQEDDEPRVECEVRATRGERCTTHTNVLRGEEAMIAGILIGVASGAVKADAIVRAVSAPDDDDDRPLMSDGKVMRA